MQEVDNFFNRWRGKSLDVDGFPAEQPYQCVDVFHKYNQEVLGVGYISASPVGGAIDYFNNFDGLHLSQWYERISNDMSNASQLPQKGDVIVWGTAMGTYGHIAIYESGNSSSFTSFDQNFGGRFCHDQSHGWASGVLGWLRPKKFIVDPSTQLQANQRILENKDGVYQRAAPNTSASIIKDWPYDKEPFNFKGYVRGQDPYGDGNNIWYVGAISGGYFWSGAFTNKTTSGLDDITPNTPEPPVEKPYTFTKDLDCVNEVIPAAVGNFEYGNFPSKPEKIVLHDFGTKGVDTIASLISTFTKKGTEVSAHFAVSGKRIIQLVSLKDRAYHAGPQGNGFIGIELDPVQDEETIKSARKLLKELKDKGYTNIYIKHSSIMATKCGDDLDFDNYDLSKEYPPKKENGLDEENNALLKQILSIVTWIKELLGKVFK